MEDPVTQPVVIQQEQPRARAVAPEPSTWPRAAAAPMLPARLMRLTEDEQPVPGSLVAVNRPEITFGGDPKLAVVSMDDPSVNALHARLVQDPDGNFLLLDEGSVAGTWVNISRPIRVLLCPTIDSFGRVKYRFSDNPPPDRPPVVTSSLAGRSHVER
jgi:pSer/pThr/pTyr-binding forkhead associated (FHA) protein